MKRINMRVVGKTEQKQKQNEITSFFNEKSENAKSYFSKRLIFYGYLLTIGLLSLFTILEEYKESGYYGIITGGIPFNFKIAFAFIFGINTILLIELLRNLVYYEKTFYLKDISKNHASAAKIWSSLEKGKDNFEGCGLYPFLWIIVILSVFFMANISSDNEEKIKKCLHESHKCLGMIYGKGSYGQDAIYQVGKDVLHLRNIVVTQKKDYNYKVGDVILLRVSDDFPRINKVLSWTPTAEEIDKYKVPVKLIEK